MQTFLPFPDFKKSAKVLDRMRLGKQRVEAKQILMILVGESEGWKHHPAVKMWIPYKNALDSYGMIICEEWMHRGYQDSCWNYFDEHCGTILEYPQWLTEEFCKAHQSNLLRKDAKYYRKFFPGVPDDLPYIWPL